LSFWPVRPEDVSSILCGPLPTELSEDPHIRTRIISATNRRRELLSLMVENIMGIKEKMERERQRTA
jgi:hypothetical protein